MAANEKQITEVKQQLSTALLRESNAAADRDRMAASLKHLEQKFADILSKESSQMQELDITKQRCIALEADLAKLTDSNTLLTSELDSVKVVLQDLFAVLCLGFLVFSSFFCTEV